MMTPKLTLLIHGPFVGNALPEIVSAFSTWSVHTDVEIVLVVYADDLPATSELLNGLEGCPPYRLVTVKDLINPGFFNINRQLVTVQAGLREIPADHFVVKLRNDQWLDFSLLQRELENRNWLAEEQDKILTTNCFTRKDRLYHPSDMLLCGWRSALDLYYSAPQMRITHMGCEMGILKRLAEGVPFAKAFICPEIYLFQSYLRAKGWEVQYTEEDSYNAIKRYTRMVNSWEIDFRWKKDRTPYKGEGAVILPQYWRWPPFRGMEPEDISCYLRSDFEGEFTEEDKSYLQESKEIWGKFEKILRAQASGGSVQMDTVKSVERKKQLLRRVWMMLKRILRIISWFLPHGIVRVIQEVWHTEIMKKHRTSIKQTIKRFLR